MPARFDQLARRVVPVDGNDMFPIHRGAQLTVETVKAALLYGEQGARQIYVDIIRELIESDPHTYSVCSKLTAAIANAPCEWLPAKVDPDNAIDVENAQTVCDFVERVVCGIPDWVTHKRGMLWGLIFAVSIREVMWESTGDAWLIKSLEFIHTRRVAYDSKFRPTIVDAFGNFTSIRPKDPEYRGKFFLFEAQLSDEYPTREGVGRVLAYWLAFKRFGAREFVSYVESRGKPLADVAYEVGERSANEKEVEDAEELAKQWSAGSTGGTAHPSTIKVQLVGPGAGTASASETPHLALIRLCDEQNSKAVLGGTLSTQEGDRGARSLGETQEKGETNIYIAAAKMFDGAIKRDLATMIVELNYGPAGRKYIPTHHTKVEPPEDDELAMKTVGGLADRGQPIKTTWVSERFGIPHAEPGDTVLCKDGAVRVMKDPEEMEEAAEVAKQAAEQANAPAQGEDDANKPGETAPAKEEKP